MLRREKFIEGAFFHIFNKSIAGYEIFKMSNNSQKIIDTIDYYNNKLAIKSFSEYLKNNSYNRENLLNPKENSFVKILSYSIMPDHYHLVIKLLTSNNLSDFMKRIESSFSHFFNLKFNRKGPLWQSRFKAVRIKTDEQLLHVTRYVHLNATTGKLVELPEDWDYSSYKSIVADKRYLEEILTEISIRDPKQYKKFCEDQIDYQKSLKLIKRLVFD